MFPNYGKVKRTLFPGPEQVKLAYLYRHSSLLALVWGVLELFYNKILLDRPISIIH